MKHASKKWPLLAIHASCFLMKFASPTDNQNHLHTAKTMFQHYLNWALSSSFWREKAILLLVKHRGTKSRYIPTSSIRYSSMGNIVGVSAKGNCKDFDKCASVSKRKAPVCTRGYFDMSRGHSWKCDILTIASRDIKIKLFARRYV